MNACCYRSAFSHRITILIGLGWMISACSTTSIHHVRYTITPSQTLPETTPWDLTALSAPPAMEWHDRTGEVWSLYYEGLTYNGHPTRVFAYYATPGTLAHNPALDRNLPAMVLVHGGGGKAFREWAELWAKRGYAAIAMDLAGNGPDGARLPDGGPDQSDDTKFGKIDASPNEQWTYHAVADVILAHSLIRSFPEIDPHQTTVTGISWGGYLTCIVAGLDNRFRAAVPVYGCGFLDTDSVWLKRFEQMTPTQRRKWMQLWDPSSYIGSTTVPILFVNGGKDFAYPPDSYAKTYGLVKKNRYLRFTPDLPHGHIFDNPPEIEIFIERILHGGKPLPEIHSPKVADNQVKAKVTSYTKLVSAGLSYTTDPLHIPDNTKREWITVPAILEGQRFTTPAPPSNTTIWFVTVTDERGVTVSSELKFSK